MPPDASSTRLSPILPTASPAQTEPETVHNANRVAKPVAQVSVAPRHNALVT